MSENDIAVTLKVVDRASPVFLELSAQMLAYGDGKRWASLTGWQRDKYRRLAKKRHEEYLARVRAESGESA